MGDGCAARTDGLDRVAVGGYTGGAFSSTMDTAHTPGGLGTGLLWLYGAAVGHDHALFPAPISVPDPVSSLGAVRDLHTIAEVGGSQPRRRQTPRRGGRYSASNRRAAA